MSDKEAEREPRPGQEAGPEPDAPPRLEEPSPQEAIRAGDKPDELLVFDHGFVRLDGAMADDLSVVNGARVSFAVRKDAMDERDKGLIRFLMREKHGSPFEHNAFRFHIRTPIFVAREWFRHRIGCLTGDTEVTFVDINGHTRPELRKTVSELWRMWTVRERNGHVRCEDDAAAIEGSAASGSSLRTVAPETGVGRHAVTRHVHQGSTDHRDSRFRVRRMRLRVLNEDTTEFDVGRVLDVIDSGVQPVYRLTLADGKSIRLTENHRILTEHGWKSLREAVGLQGVGETAVMTQPCRVMTNGQPAHRDRRWLEARRRKGATVTQMAASAGCSYHTIRAWLRKHRRGTKEQAPTVHARLDYTCQSCGRRGGRLHDHHISPVWLDRSRARVFGNLVPVCDACHGAIHRTQATEIESATRWSSDLRTPTPRHVPPKGWSPTARTVQVVSCDFVGWEQTYDLCVEGPWHNFVANGIVVHNSFNEESARYHRLEGDFYVPAADAVRSQVGKPGSYSFEPVDPALAEDARATFARVYRQLYDEYQGLIDKGVAKELARALLPFGIYTQFYWTLNARSLMNFLSLRNSQSAQYEIRTYAEAVERLFARRMPVTYECFLEFGRRVP